MALGDNEGEPPLSDDDIDWTDESADIAASQPADCRDAEGQPQKVILHFDLDCFYAQVEMIRNPALWNLPLAVHQKYFIVTCNYLARELGVTKRMMATEARSKCPELVLLNGEDLTPYREISYKVTELLESFCPLVERLGLDENFVDVTELVEKKLKKVPLPSDVSVNGHIYNQQALDTTAPDHHRLALGSHIAAEFRAAVHTQLGLTGCAGIAPSKVLAKLVSGTFRPNQQTTLLPESSAQLMRGLIHVRAIPSVGRSTAMRLQALGIHSVVDLQRCPLPTLEKELGGICARRIHCLSLGIDPLPVTPRGPPQSLSDEDSFKKVSTEVEVMQKVKELVSSLLHRLHRDGRVPRTMRLTIKRFSESSQPVSRESRQCPLPTTLGQKIRSGSWDAVTPLVSLAMKLFFRLVDRHMPFHITLISVCFTNLQLCCLGTRGSIVSFFSQGSPVKPKEAPSAESSGPTCQQGALDTSGNQDVQEASLVASAPLQQRSAPSPPPGVDPSVFWELPEEIQRELRSSAASAPVPDCPGSTASSAPRLGLGQHASREASSPAVLRPPSLALRTLANQTQSLNPSLNSPVHEVPSHVDPQVFVELPTELQGELLAEWKRETRTPPSTPPSQTLPSPKRGWSRPSKGKKLNPSNRTQVNNLLRYFKPC
ncbi:DNA polymerase iota isoform X1 [Paramormyrops kingsleyae]|uniref:DNA polymerase iota isoform X1 n=1 Tax=Paramormyrops kingsleyae TaxID=1676925 RepID=UPI003B978F60